MIMNLRFSLWFWWLPDFKVGLQTLVQSFGIGPLHGNVVLFNWMENARKGLPGIRESLYVQGLRSTFRFGCNIVILHAEESQWNALEKTPRGERRIDLWWRNDETGRLMLLLAYLITRNDYWHEARIRVLAVSNSDTFEQTKADLDGVLQDARIDAEPLVIENGDAGILSEYSHDASFVYMPFRMRGNKIITLFEEDIEDLPSRLPPVALFLASEDIDLNAEPDEGMPAEIAAALDALNEAEKRAKAAEEEAERASEQAAAKLMELRKAAVSGTDVEKLARLEALALEAKDESNKAARKAAKARAKVEYAVQNVEKLGVKPPEANEKNGKQNEEQAAGPTDD